MGLSDSERQSVLGHAVREMTMHYTHVEDERVRAGLERVVDRLLKKREAEGLVEFKENKA